MFVTHSFQIPYEEHLYDGIKEHAKRSRICLE